VAAQVRPGDHGRGDGGWSYHAGARHTTWAGVGCETHGHSMGARGATGERVGSPRSGRGIYRDMIEKIAHLLADREWRLANLYSIRNRYGRTVPFRRNPSQEWFDANRHTWTLLTKSRQHGFSTREAIDIADECIFNEDRKCGLIDKRIEDAKGKLEMARYAWETMGLNVPGLDDREGGALNERLRAAFPLTINNETRLVWANGSSFQASTSFRGGTLQRLWVSEFGYIAIHRPKDARKILSGALPALAAGNRCTFESTHEGGKYGEHYRLIEEATAKAGRELASQEFRFLFIPFQANPDNRMDVSEWEFRPEEREVFRRWKRQGVELSLQQRAFWSNKFRTLPRYEVFREYPAVMEDMFLSPVEGAIYADILTRRELQGRVTDFDVASRFPSYIAWDLGGSNTAIWHVQDHPEGARWLHYHQAARVDLAEYLRLIEDWHAACPVVKHLLPHDAGGTEKDGRTFVDELRTAGAHHMVVVPQCRSVWQGIGELHNIFETSWFHSRVKDRLRIGDREGSAWDYLNQYRVEQREEGATVARQPKKDHTSHCADAARTFAEAKLHGLLGYAQQPAGARPPQPIIETIGI